MNLNQLSTFAKSHSAQIALGISAVGLIATSVLSARGHLQASTIRYEKTTNDRENIKRAIKARWKCYVPPVLVGACTIAAMGFGYRAQTKQIAAISTAYAMTSNAYEAYKLTAAKTLGAQKAQEIASDSAAMLYDHDVSNTPVILGNGEVPCQDAYTGRYFASSAEAIRRAVNNINARVIHEGTASLNDLYSELNLKRIPVGDDIGWTTDHLCEIDLGTVMREDGTPCISILFTPQPTKLGYNF